MKIITILGTRPEIIRLSRIIPILDSLVDHKLVHTGQNYDTNLNAIFFNELRLRQPDYILDCKSDTAMGQIGKILLETEKILSNEKPDRLLLLGDTNSALSAIVAKRMGIPVFHMEAGNRCYDARVPEEINRRIIDHSSDVLLPYTDRSRANLLAEGFPLNRVFVTGNPILEVLDYYKDEIASSTILNRLGLTKNGYMLLTLHRAENVDVPERLAMFITALERLYEIYNVPIVCSVHPRMRSQLEKQGKSLDMEGIIPLDPLGLFDFVNLEQTAKCVLSDSGTVQEECAIFGTPNITLRDVTERPETLEAGSNYISGSDTESILRGVKLALEYSEWNAPAEYMKVNVANTVSRLLLGHWH